MYLDIYKNWISSPKISEQGEKELKDIEKNKSEIEYRFGKDLEFGTAGMRGLIGLGTNMMNIFTVARATQGLAKYIKSLDKSAVNKGVVVSYDTREMSVEFARISALTLVSNGIKAFMFTDVHPVPMLSFAVRELNAVAGIMITASHNPKEYNGYKLYGEDGAQMSPENTETVVGYIQEIKDCLSDEILCYDAYQKKIKSVPKRIDKKYYNKLKKLALSSKDAKMTGKNIKLVYTPVHGSGYIPVTTVLKKIGIHPILVPEQTNPDIKFSTVEVPNPEFKETLSLAMKMADIKKADVVLGTDPDCDRLGVAVRNDDGEFVVLSGNQTGVLLLDYVLARLKETGKLNQKGFVVKSFVTTDMAKFICDDYGVELFDVPVGFKFIGEKIKELDDTGKRNFIFGMEESCGYLRGTHARDKDAVVASMLFAEMVCYYTHRKVGIYDRLKELYDKYGFVYDVNESKVYSGINAMREMNSAVDKVKKQKINKLGGIKILAMRDYSQAKRYCADGSEENMDSNKANAIYYELEGGGFVCLRPSGTEPKLKMYFSVTDKDEKSAKKCFEKIKEDFISKI